MHPKKTMRKRLEKLISVTCALALAFCLPISAHATGSTASNDAENAASAPQVSLMTKTSADFKAAGKGTIISQSNGNLTIDRIKKDNETSMSGSEDGSWTIMVYMCGSDLESEGSAATSDITEMLAATPKKPATAT